MHHYPRNNSSLSSVDLASDIEANYSIDDTIASISKDIKHKFIMKIYTILSIQLAVTFGMSLMFYNIATLHTFILNHTWLLWLTTIFTFVFVLSAIPYGKYHPHGLLILSGFTLCESYSIAYVCTFYTTSSVILCWGLTLSTFIFLSAYVYITKSDFNFLGAGLYSCLWIVILGGIIQIIFLPNNQFLNTTIAVMGAMVAVGYILYDTSDIIHRLEPDDYIYACMSLYLDIILLFIKLLELIGVRNTSD